MRRRVVDVASRRRHGPSAPHRRPGRSGSFSTRRGQPVRDRRRSAGKTEMVVVSTLATLLGQRFEPGSPIRSRTVKMTPDLVDWPVASTRSRGRMPAAPRRSHSCSGPCRTPATPPETGRRTRAAPRAGEVPIPMRVQFQQVRERVVSRGWSAVGIHAGRPSGHHIPTCAPACRSAVVSGDALAVDLPAPATVATRSIRACPIRACFTLARLTRTRRGAA